MSDQPTPPIVTSAPPPPRILMREEIRAIVREVIQESGSGMSEEQIRSVVQQAVRDTLTQIGANVSEPFELQRDFQFIRTWRTSSESARAKALVVTIGVLVSGLLGAVFMGLRELLTNRH